jgi:hypothetical protein
VSKVKCHNDIFSETKRRPDFGGLRFEKTMAIAMAIGLTMSRNGVPIIGSRTICCATKTERCGLPGREGAGRDCGYVSAFIKARTVSGADEGPETDVTDFIEKD